MRTKPNVVLILVDDMGFTDLGIAGSEIKTPNIDQLARDGTSNASRVVRHAACSVLVVR